MGSVVWPDLFRQCLAQRCELVQLHVCGHVQRGSSQLGLKQPLGNDGPNLWAGTEHNHILWVFGLTRDAQTVACRPQPLGCKAPAFGMPSPSLAQCYRLAAYTATMQAQLLRTQAKPHRTEGVCCPGSESRNGCGGMPTLSATAVQWPSTGAGDSGLNCCWPITELQVHSQPACHNKSSTCGPL